MKKNKFLLPILASVLIFVGIVGVTTAFLTSESQKVNRFSMGNIEIDVEENFPEPGNCYPEGCVKQVQIENKSNGPVLIRVNITPRWVDEENNAWAGDVSLVELGFENLTANLAEKDKWMDGGDGYYYYTSKLNEKGLTSMLLNSVLIKEQLPPEYKGKQLIVDVNAEAVQGTKEAYRSTWNNLSTTINELLDMLCDE